MASMAIATSMAPFSIRTRPVPVPVPGGGPSIRTLRICASSTPNPNPTTHSEGDLKYLLKLGGGTVLGSVLIKYGSIAVPEITRPNIVQALLMISTPVVVALALLLKQSTKE